MSEKLGYKRLETDEEFLKRVCEKYPWYVPWASRGEGLDASVWNSFEMQRRIVEVFP